MPIKSLPPNPSLDHLKHQARDLHITLTQGHAEACARAREFHPGFATMSDEQIRHAKPSLADAQWIVAREYGFPSWPKLKHHVESLVKAITSTMAPPPGFQAPSGPVELKVKWPLGARIVREIDLKQNMEIYAPAKAEPVKQELFLMSQYAYTVVKELPNGGREVELQHLSFQFEFNSEGHLWRYESARSPAADQSEIAKMFQMMLRAKVRYFLDAGNQVERMEGVDELVNRLNFYEGAKLKPGMTWDHQALDKVISRIRSGAGPHAKTAAWLRNMFTDTYFKNKLEILGASVLPDKAIQPGYAWTFSRESRKAKRSVLNRSIMQDAAVTFLSWEMRADRLCARLDFHGTEKTSPQVESETARRIHPVTEGTFSGVVWFDPESGRAIESNMNHDFKVTSNKLVMAVPFAKPAFEAVTDYHHQAVTTRLVSVHGAG